MEPPTLGAALLCSSWAGTDDMMLYPELIPLCIVYRDGVTTLGVLIHWQRVSVELSIILLLMLT